MQTNTNILKCITNWSAGTFKSPIEAAKTGVKGGGTNERPFFTSPTMAPRDKTNSSRDLQVYWENLDVMPEASDATSVTLLGPPKQYYGFDEDRYAYMLHEAVFQLERNGFSTNTLLLQAQSQRKKKYKKQHRRVPGLLGFLLNDMNSNTKIAIFEPSGNLVASLGFRTCKQPWLSVCCRSTAKPEQIEQLQIILSKKFFLIKIPYECKSFSIPKSATNASGATDSDALSVTMITGDAEGMPHAVKGQKELCTNFVFARDGQTVAEAWWSFANETRDSVGPSLEVLETAGSDIDLNLVLSTMEGKMMQFVGPLVAFRLRVCKLNDPGAAKWLSKRGYRDAGDGTGGLCKAFVVI